MGIWPKVWNLYPYLWIFLTQEKNNNNNNNKQKTKQNKTKQKTWFDVFVSLFVFPLNFCEITSSFNDFLTKMGPMSKDFLWKTAISDSRDPISVTYKIFEAGQLLIASVSHFLQKKKKNSTVLKGTRMGPMVVLVSPCFRERVNVTCKIVSFLFSLDNFLLKNAIIFVFGNKISKWHSFEKRAIFDLLFTFCSHHGKDTKIPSAHIPLTYIHIFRSPYWLFCLPNFPKIVNLSCMVSLWCDSWCWFFFAPFWSNQKVTKWEQNSGWNVYYWYPFTLMENL